MWETPCGTRKLEGRERAPFVQTVLTLYDLLRGAQECGDDPELGVRVFDHIPLGDRALILLWVAEHVLGDAPAPAVRAWNAGTIAAVFAHLETMIELEIDSDELHQEESADELKRQGLGFLVNKNRSSRYTWRKLVHEAWMERCFPECGITFQKGEGDKQPLESKDLDQWTFKIHGLAGELLDDADYEMEEFMDLAPGPVAGAKDYLGIEEDYFTSVPPVWSPQDKERLTEFHETLLRETRGE